MRGAWGKEDGSSFSPAAGVSEDYFDDDRGEASEAISPNGNKIRGQDTRDEKEPVGEKRHTKG